MTISILGAGAFGTALAISLAQRAPVTLWSRTEADAQAVQQTRENSRRLPGLPLPKDVAITSDISIATASETLLLAVPMQSLRKLCQDHRALFQGKALVACCKGLELGSHLGPVQILSAEVPGATPALLTGPSFAKDIARGLPTALVLACADENAATILQQSLTTQNLRLYTSNDTLGAELGGAMKNVMALACGAVMGAGLGESARAALMTRGFAEMMRLAEIRGADPRTLNGLSGFGDLALTCTSEQSRNYQMGFALGSGSEKTPDATVEGIATALSIAAMATEENLDLPITQIVAALVSGDISVPQAVQKLLSRPLRPE